MPNENNVLCIVDNVIVFERDGIEIPWKFKTNEDKTVAIDIREVNKTFDKHEEAMKKAMLE